MQNQKVCFIGLGVMGAPMAGHVANAGYPTTVFNRSAEKMSDWAAKYPGRAADSLRTAVSDADIVLMCLGNDDSVESTLIEGGVIESMPAG